MEKRDVSFLNCFVHRSLYTYLQNRYVDEQLFKLRVQKNLIMIKYVEEFIKFNQSQLEIDYNVNFLLYFHISSNTSIMKLRFIKGYIRL